LSRTFVAVVSSLVRSNDRRWEVEGINNSGGGKWNSETEQSLSGKSTLDRHCDAMAGGQIGGQEGIVFGVEKN
jgi:hypothetical protein